MTDWRIEGRELANCNCNYGCPCQFGVLPTDGVCEAAVAIQIDRGHYGDVRLDGLMAAALYKWPGPIHDGNGQMQLIIDARATDEQRAALDAIMSGQDTEDMATMWWVYSTMAPNRHKTLYKHIKLDLDSDRRIGSASVPGVVNIGAKPIPNIVTGAPHTIHIGLPHGFEFARAEMASGTTRTFGEAAIALEKNKDSHAHFAHLHLTGKGVVREAA